MRQGYFAASLMSDNIQYRSAAVRRNCFCRLTMTSSAGDRRNCSPVRWKPPAASHYRHGHAGSICLAFSMARVSFSSPPAIFYEKRRRVLVFDPPSCDFDALSEVLLTLTSTYRPNRSRNCGRRPPSSGSCFRPDKLRVVPVRDALSLDNVHAGGCRFKQRLDDVIAQQIHLVHIKDVTVGPVQRPGSNRFSPYLTACSKSNCDQPVLRNINGRSTIPDMRRRRRRPDKRRFCCSLFSADENAAIWD